MAHHSRPHVVHGLCECDCRHCTLPRPDGFLVCICKDCDARRCGMHSGVLDATLAKNTG